MGPFLGFFGSHRRSWIFTYYFQSVLMLVPRECSLSWLSSYLWRLVLNKCPPLLKGSQCSLVFLSSHDNNSCLQDCHHFMTTFEPALGSFLSRLNYVAACHLFGGGLLNSLYQSRSLFASLASSFFGRVFYALSHWRLACGQRLQPELLRLQIRIFWGVLQSL